jgi:SAM-dependent methyltransferase
MTMRSQGVVHAGRRELEASFDRVAAHYDLLCRLNRGYRTHLRWSAERLGLAPGARILDLCCGTGLSTAALVATYPDADIVGLDISRGMLAHARRQPDLAACHARRWRRDGPGGRRRARALRRHPDGVRPAQCADPDLCLQRLHDLLAPGGVLCVHEYSVADSRRSRWSGTSSPALSSCRWRSP